MAVLDQPPRDAELGLKAVHPRLALCLLQQLKGQCQCKWICLFHPLIGLLRPLALLLLQIVHDLLERTLSEDIIDLSKVEPRDTDAG